MPFQLSTGGGSRSKLMKRAYADINVRLTDGSRLGTTTQYSTKQHLSIYSHGTWKRVHFKNRNVSKLHDIIFIRYIPSIAVVIQPDWKRVSLCNTNWNWYCVHGCSCVTSVHTLPAARLWLSVHKYVLLFLQKQTAHRWKTSNVTWKSWSEDNRQTINIVELEKLHKFWQWCLLY